MSEKRRKLSKAVFKSSVQPRGKNWIRCLKTKLQEAEEGLLG